MTTPHASAATALGLLTVAARRMENAATGTGD